MGLVDLRGKRVLVTGGTTGIGRATIVLLLAHGADVLTFGRHREELDEVLALADGADGSIRGLVADAASQDGIADVFAAVDADLGGIDILVANAALGAQPIHEMSDEAWRYLVDVNFVGCLASARPALLRMIAAGGGHILFVGSIATEIKAVGESVYAATKAGVQAFAETLRKEVAEKGVRVSVVQPGSVSAPMQECSENEKREAVEEARMLEAEQVAQAILFVLTRPAEADVVNLRIEPRIQKSS
ncbi:SDR family oxidoreductase [Novosphingobium sp. JCM 18896]|uniref:SDR family oxidoreductase n=1 Tax=Novosphingobium sp. JCM 18896 TaxID=2989731 RepID=UPI0022219F00|nr:SDR family NAD(P)-dependent oxidoreductase [Novosphingobium sp. JCM 18896]MCW1432229.1 SDR family NAD(P)-dependent oxidoreductase [Novosphingobium sp. JCM 18896]